MLRNEASMARRTKNRVAPAMIQIAYIILFSYIYIQIKFTDIYSFVSGSAAGTSPNLYIAQLILPSGMVQILVPLSSPAAPAAT